MNHWNQQTGYEVDLEDDRLYPQRSPSSTIRFRPIDTGEASSQALTRPPQQQIRRRTHYDEVNYFIRTRPKKATKQKPRTTEERPLRQTQEAKADTDEPETQPPRRRRIRASLPRLDRWGYIGLGMLAFLLLIVILNWWSGVQDDLHYGHPRTYQTDMRVGHNDALTPSHFIALNLNHQVEVIEFPGGDATHAKVYLGPTLSGTESDLDVVTLNFKDVNGDNKPDMVVSVNGGTSLFINDNGAFRTVRPDDHVKM